MERFFSDTRYAISWGILGIFIASILLSIFLVFQTINVIEDDSGMLNTITIVGEGEVVAVPDIATFSFTASKISPEVSTAQEDINGRITSAVDFLAENGVEEKDIKTTSYSAYPRYEWRESFCLNGICPPGKQEMIGYEVSQTISVKIRNTEKVGDILDGIGSLGLDNISSLSFVVDDEEALQNQARSKAIQDAKEQAKMLSKELGVDIKDIISFSESNNIPMYESYGMGGMTDSRSFSKTEAVIPMGESNITSQVYVVFELD